MKLLDFLLIALCVGNSCIAESSFPYQRQHISMLRAVIVNDNLPTTLVMLTKWSLANRMDFTKNMGFLNQFQSMNENVTISQNINANTVVLVVDLEADGSLNYLENRVNVTYFSFPFRWIMLRLNESRGNNDKRIFSLPSPLDNNVLLATWSREIQTFHLEQFYRTEPTATIIHEPYGSWAPSTGLTDARTLRILSQRRRNLRKMSIQASTVILNNDTLNHLTDYRNPHIDSLSRVCYVLISILSDMLNATQRFKFVDTWGYFDPVTKQINGMLGDILAKRSLITGTSLFIVSERVGLYEYIAMLTPTRIEFIFRAPPLSYVSNIYALPFSGAVWLASAFLIVVSCICIYAAMCRQQAKEMQSAEGSVRPSDVALLGVGAICQMGSTLEAHRFSGKVSTIFFLVFLLFLYTSYTANIVSLLQATTKSIRTLDDLLNSKMDFGVLDTPYQRWFVANVVGKTRRAIYEKKIAPPNQSPNFVNQTYGVARLRQGAYAYHSELGPTYRLVEDTFNEYEKCGLTEIDLLGMPEPGVVIQKYSPYKELIKINLFRLRELGIQKRENNKIYTKRPICTASGQNFQSVRLIDCYIVIKVLLIGYGTSAAIFVIEKVFYAKFKGKSFEVICIQ